MRLVEPERWKPLTTARQCVSLCVVTFVLLVCFISLRLRKREFLMLVICPTIYNRTNAPQPLGPSGLPVFLAGQEDNGSYSSRKAH